MSRYMDFDDYYPRRTPGHLPNQSDLENAASAPGNFEKGIGGTRHGSYVQATGAWRWSAARSRSVDYLD
jgi:hypothetical protein